MVYEDDAGNTAGQGPVLILAELQKPEAGLGEILVHVHAAGHVVHVRVLPGGTGAVLGHQHPVVDRAAVEHQSPH